jgi:hypothetical protein
VTSATTAPTNDQTEQASGSATGTLGPVAARPGGGARTPARRTAWRRPVVAVAAGATLVIGCRVAGELLRRHGDPLHLSDAYPIAGNWQHVLSPWLAVPVLAAAAALGVWPRLVAALRWRSLLVASFLASAAWAVALNLVAGPAGLTRPLAAPGEYPHDVHRVTNLGTFLSTFNHYVTHHDDSRQWTVHVGGHPPGALGVFVLLDRAGLGGLGWASALVILGGALATPCVLSTVKLLAGQRGSAALDGSAGVDGEVLARRAAVFVPLAPVALWIASSADALFAGVAALGLTALAHAAVRRDRRSDLLAAAGGLLLGLCLFLSYGLSLLAPLAVGVVLVQRWPVRRRSSLSVLGAPRTWRHLLWAVRPLLVGGLVVLGLLLAARVAGFDWIQGLRLAAQRTRQGQVWIDRPTAYFVFANVAALVISVGPAVVGGLGMLRRSRLAVLPVAVAVAVAGALVSNLSKGEVERIYLPFAVWLLPFAALLPWPGRAGRPAGQWWSGRALLAVQLGWAVLISATVQTWW